MLYLLTRSPALFICVSYVICTLSTAHFSTKWPTLEQELKDEANDIAQLKAVQRSMNEWEKIRKHHRKKRADKSVCYGELGCFEDSGPFGYLEMLPSSPEEINTKFFFYSTKNRSDRPLVELPYLNMTAAWKEFAPTKENVSTTSSSEKNATSPTASTKLFRNSKTWKSLKSFQGLDNLSVRIIVHGFGSSCSHVWIYEMRTALMAVEDCIVICVDWENGASLPNYVRASANTRLIGKQLAMLLKGLQEFKGLELSRVHIIGFSLGAHVSGFAGAESSGLSRITGLDPAGPLFESQHSKARLDSTDANFVDVIHSNGENLILGGLGSWQPMGHVDFYPNGGRVQHGCSNLFVGAVTDFIWSPAAAVEGRSLCNHRRAYKFFIDSVAPRCLFPAFPCDSFDDFLKGRCFPCDSQLETSSSGAKCGNMGYYADRSTGRGQLYLVTREEEPFCAHQFNIEIYSSESDIPLKTLGKLEVILEGESSLNETFSITEKDDAEFFAGDVMSRILVPHPALGFPHSITLAYKPYSGWLTKGLQQWTIHKIVLTDSFGESMSLCQRNIELESDKPVYLKLQPGDCYIADENDVTVGPQDKHQGSKDESSTKIDINRLDENKQSTAGPLYNDDDDKLREKKEVIDLGSNFKIIQNQTHSYSEQTKPEDALPWHPLLESGNALDRDTTAESSRTFRDAEIFEPILRDRNRNGAETSRTTSITEKDESTNKVIKNEIMEPVLKSTTQKSRKTKNVVVSTAGESVKPRENSFFTIQLLPFRLGELIERAERYARETLLPLISEQAPRFFGFGRTDSRSDRQPKYFPPLGEIADTEPEASQISERRIDMPPNLNGTSFIEVPDYEDAIDRKNETHISDNRNVDFPDEIVEIDDRRSEKDILSLLRQNQPIPTVFAKPAPAFAQSRSYYTNPEEINTAVRRRESSVSDDRAVTAVAAAAAIRIDLPTYKPSMRSLISAMSFPYQYDIPSSPTSSENDRIKIIPVYSQPVSTR